MYTDIRPRLTSAALVLCATVAQPLFAYNTKGATTDPDFSFSVNASSFALLNGHAVSSAEAVFWTQYALSQWIDRSGVDLRPTYAGTTTASCENNNDGINTIGVIEGCAFEDVFCEVAARHFSRTNVAGDEYLEHDICLYDANNGVNWELRLASVAAGQTDIVAVLVHEWGHWLGLNHTANTVMNATYTNQSMRYPHGDDIEGLRDYFSSEGLIGLSSYWRERTNYSNSWSSVRSMGGSGSFQPRRSDIGATSGGTDYVVSAAADQGGERVYFKRSSYPLGTSASWSNYYYSYDAWVTPAISSNHNSVNGQFLAGWPEPTVTSASPGNVRFLRSTSAMSGATTFTKGDMPTLLSPAIEWLDFYDGGFVAYYLIVWVNYDGEDTGQICYRTSTDGSSTSFSTPTCTGIYTLDTPGLACNGANCQLTYIRASSDTSEMVNRAITMDSSGVMTLGSYTVDGRRHQRESDMVWGGEGIWIGANFYSTSSAFLPRGWGSIYTYHNVSYPMPATYYSIGESAEQPATLAGNDAYSEVYLFYVD